MLEFRTAKGLVVFSMVPSTLGDALSARVPAGTCIFSSPVTYILTMKNTLICMSISFLGVKFSFVDQL